MPAAETFEHRIASLAPHMETVRPAGAGPFPAVLQFHGCGGVKPIQHAYARAANAAGWAAVIVDSYAHRGIGPTRAKATVCTGLRLWGRERAGDLYAAIEWTRRQPWADETRLALAGWSHGGWTVLDALAMSPAQAARATGLSGLPDDLTPGVRAVFLVYPYCGVGSAPPRAWPIAPKAAAIVAGRDFIVGAHQPMRALQRLKQKGADIDVHYFGRATHAFDEAGARDLRVRYDRALTARAEALYQEVLRAA